MKTKLFNVLTAVILFLIPNLNFGQAPVLGTLAKYAVFTTVGAVTNTSIPDYLTHITGNVGTNSDPTIPGFGNIDGQMHVLADSLNTLAATDLLSLRNQLKGRVPTFFPAPLLGNGQTLLAGVDSIFGATVLNLDLTLDAQNVAGALFIIKIAGPLSANANSKVKLVNGALACNVFWQIEGLVDIATNSTLKGTVISVGAAINMAVGDTLEGRAVSTNGAITLNGVLIYMPIGCGSPFLVGPAAPVLASVACYSIFTSNGALANSPISTSIGDVGSNGGGTVTGWSAGDVTGTLHLVQDPSTIAAAVDLSNAYTAINALPIDIELLAPAELGHSLVLTPHCYHMGASAMLTDTLILDAQTNANAVFVIKLTGGDLITGTYAYIKLINGAQSKNVYWMVQGGRVDINNYSVFRGTIIVSAGAINLVNTGVVLDGRAFTMNGAITTAGMAIVIPSGCNPPIITTEPANQTVCLGTSASFSVVASGTNITYQWRKGTVNLSNGANISGATSAMLTINPATFADTAYNYNVVITGSALPNDTSINVFLKINSAPSITTQPSNKIACTGGLVVFSVAATGTGLTYQWKKGVTNIVGAISSSLTINPVSITDTAYNYNVVVSGTCLPKANSINVSLTVNTAPNITTQPNDTTVCSGSSASFSVVAAGAGISYQWRKGNAIIAGANLATLTINPATISDTAYNYNVIVSGTCLPNDTSVNVSLTVNTAPNINAQPTSQTTCAGSSVSFSVAGAGTGLSYQWRKGLSNLSNGVSISGVTTSTLTINPASITDTAYNYNVVITGACGAMVTSANVSLTVNPIPPAVASSNSPICAGSAVNTLNLFAQTVTGATYSWTGPNGYTSAVQNPVILNATTLDAGNYSLTVTLNGCISGTSTTTVIVNNCLTDLSVVKTADNVHPFIGNSIVFTIVATNGGPDNATGVAINDILQNGYTYVASTVTAGTFDASTGVWTIGSFANGASATLTITVTVNATGNYVNTALIYGNEVDPNMANNVSSIEPIPTDFFIPEGFSPNGDGINDVFVIRGILNYPENTFVIFNRWGNKVYETTHYQNTWDGRATLGLRVGGDELPVGTFFYVLDLGDGTPIFKGTIYLNK